MKLSDSYNSPQHRVHNQEWYLVLDTTSGSLFLGPFRNLGFFLGAVQVFHAHPSPFQGAFGVAKYKSAVGLEQGRVSPGAVGIPGVTASSRNLFIFQPHGRMKGL